MKGRFKLLGRTVDTNVLRLCPLVFANTNASTHQETLKTPIVTVDEVQVPTQGTDRLEKWWSRCRQTLGSIINELFRVPESAVFQHK